MLCWWTRLQICLWVNIFGTFQCLTRKIAVEEAAARARNEMRDSHAHTHFLQSLNISSMWSEKRVIDHRQQSVGEYVFIGRIYVTERFFYSSFLLHSTVVNFCATRLSLSQFLWNESGRGFRSMGNVLYFFRCWCVELAIGKLCFSNHISLSFFRCRYIFFLRRKDINDI